MNGDVGEGKNHQDSGEDHAQKGRPVAVGNVIRGRYVPPLFREPKNLDADYKEREGHKACSVGHNREKRVTRAVTGSRKAEKGKGGEIGSRHGKKQEERTETPAGKVKLIYACRGLPPESEADEESKEKITAYNKKRNMSGVSLRASGKRNCSICEDTI